MIHFKPKEAIEFAMASGVMKHSVPGDVLTCSLQEVKELILAKGAKSGIVIHASKNYENIANIIKNFDEEISNFVQVCPKEMLDKLAIRQCLFYLIHYHQQMW